MWEATDNGHLEPITLLLQAGADKDKVNPFHGLTAMQRATRKDHSHVADYLRKQGARDIDAERAEFDRLAELQAWRDDCTSSDDDSYSSEDFSKGARIVRAAVVVGVSAVAAGCSVM